MKMKHNWFSRLAFVIAGGALLYLYQFMLRSQFAVWKESFGPGVIPVIAAAAVIAAGVWALWRTPAQKLTLRCEGWIALGILAAGVLLRIAYVLLMPIEPQSDFLRYSNGAEYIVNGTLQTEGSWFCDYIVLFPKTIGYSLLLSLVYGLFGTSNVLAAQLVNIALAMGSCVLAWRITRRIAGKNAGLTALLLSVFFPSQILFVNVLASEYLYVFLMMLCLWLMTLLFEALKQGRTQMIWWCAPACGALIAIAQNVRAIAGLVLAAAVICLLSMRGRLPGRRRFVSAGCALLLTACFIIAGSAADIGIERLIGRKLDGGIADSGWNLYVGLNRESVGSYNDGDVAFWNELNARSATPGEAKKACLQAAVERAFSDVASLPKLMVGKFEKLWGDDLFSCDYNLIYKGQQGTLTSAQADFLKEARLLCSLYYMMMLAFSGVYVVKAWRQKELDVGYLMLLIWLGTIAAHLLLETMNRYHFHVLSLLPVLAAFALFPKTEEIKEA